jgi:hypothetical protein
MRWLTIVFIALATAGTAAAQVFDSGPTVVRSVPTVTLPIAPLPYGLSNSIIDHNGRLLIFDVTFDYSAVLSGTPPTFRPAPATKTKVTIIDSDGSTKHDSTFSGTFQVVGAGRWAVYAIVTDNSVSATPTQAPSAITRRLVALGPAFPTLPAVNLAGEAQVKVSAVGDGSAPDMIVTITSSPSPVVLPPVGIMGPLPASPVQSRTVQMFQFNGSSFNPLTSAPIPAP